MKLPSWEKLPWDLSERVFYTPTQALKNKQQGNLAFIRTQSPDYSRSSDNQQRWKNSLQTHKAFLVTPSVDLSLLTLSIQDSLFPWFAIWNPLCLLLHLVIPKYLCKLTGFPHKLFCLQILSYFLPSDFKLRAISKLAFVEMGILFTEDFFFFINR